MLWDALIVVSNEDNESFDDDDDDEDDAGGEVLIAPQAGLGLRPVTSPHHS